MDSSSKQDSENLNIHNYKGKTKWLQVRYVIAFASAFLNAVLYMMRVIMSVTIVAIALDTEGDAPHYDWNSTERSAVLSSFFWGYTAVQIPAIFVVRRYGARRLGLFMSFFSSIFTVIFVPMASLGWQVACASRVLLGLAQAGLMTSVNQLIASWAPPPERARLVVYAFCGQNIGNILALACSGVISELIGWPWVFYITGMLGLILTVVWFWTVQDTPAQHPWISVQERHYIETSISDEEKRKIRTKNLKVPWRAILTSVPVWTLVATQCACAWGTWTLLTGIPSYMDGVLNFDLSENGLLSALPYFVMWATSLVLVWLSDALLKRNVWSVTASRKVANTIGLSGPAIALIILSFSNNNPTSAIALLTIAVGLNAACLIGVNPNYIDLGHNFAAITMGISNQFACFMCIIGPLMIGFIVTDNESEEQWRLVFLITSTIYFAGNALYVIFGTGKEQAWNDPEWRRKASSDNESQSASVAEKSSSKKICT